MTWRQLEMFNTESINARAGSGRMIKRTVVGLFGHLQSGKDTVADIMVDIIDRDYRVKKFALADPLKYCARELLGMPLDVSFGHGITTAERERRRQAWVYAGKNAREWLQWIGTELGRDQIDPDLWIDRAVDTVRSDIKGNHFFLISDCRFHNERDGLRQKLEEQFVRFVAVRIHREGLVVNTDHPSEQQLTEMADSQFDYVIHNDAGLDELRFEVSLICEHLYEGVYVE